MEISVSPESQSKRVIVEIGAGIKPFPASGNRGLANNEHYVGVDFYHDPNDAERADQKLKALQSGSYELTKPDGTHIPLKDHMADEVVLCNVLGDPRVERTRLQLIKEAKRIMKKDTGVITIVENYTPFSMPLRNLRLLMAQQGLIQVNKDSQKDKNEIRQYSRDEIASEGSYIAKFSSSSAGKVKTFLRAFT